MSIVDDGGGLSIPRQPNRQRASSTGCRPQPSIDSSFCRRQQPSSDSQLTITNTMDTTTTTTTTTHTDITSPPSMPALILSRFLDWIYLQARHSRALSSSSKSSSLHSSEDSDEFILPISDSVKKSSFVAMFNEKHPPQQSLTFPRRHLTPLHAPILFVILLFPVSTALVFFALNTLPMTFSSWPKTLLDLAQLGRELRAYSESGVLPMAHVIGVISITFIWKHAWSIPGSVVWNVIAGALFSPVLATLLFTALTSIGSLCATLLAMPLAPYLAHFFPRALDLTRAAIHGPEGDTTDVIDKSASGTWIRLSVLRLIGIVPWSGINVACGVCGVPMPDVLLGSFIGTMPWTAVTCQIGDILQTIVTSPSSPTQPQTVSSLLTSPEILVKLVFLSFLSLAPLLARDRLRAWLAPPPPPPLEERQGRWAWVKESIRVGSRSRTRTREREVLDTLIKEKQEMYEVQSFP